MLDAQIRIPDRVEIPELTLGSTNKMSKNATPSCAMRFFVVQHKGLYKTWRWTPEPSTQHEVLSRFVKKCPGTHVNYLISWYWYYLPNCPICCFHIYQCQISDSGGLWSTSRLQLELTVHGRYSWNCLPSPHWKCHRRCSATNVESERTRDCLVKNSSTHYRILMIDSGFYQVIQ